MLPPFVVGDKTQNTSSGSGIWMYQDGSTINETTDLANKTIISGTNTTVNTSSQMLDVHIFGKGADFNIIPNQREVSGFTVLGNGFKLHNSLLDGSQNKQWRIDGVQIIGANSCVFDQDISWKGAVKYDDNGGAVCNVLMEGITIAGRSSSVSLPGNGGLLLCGGTTTIESYSNNGVIICGSGADKSRLLWDNNNNLWNSRYEHPSDAVHRKMHVEGNGIFICGTRYDYSDLDDKGRPKNRFPSYVQFSTNSGLKSELKGHLQLTKDCTIYDVDGRKIIEDGKLLNS